MEKHDVGPERIWIWKTGPLENSESPHWSTELHASELNAQVRVDADKGSAILAEGACDKGHWVLTVRWARLLSRSSVLSYITELKNKTKQNKTCSEIDI